MMPPFVGLIFTGSRLSVRRLPKNQDGRYRSKPGLLFILGAVRHSVLKEILNGGTRNHPK